MKENTNNGMINIHRLNYLGRGERIVLVFLLAALDNDEDRREFTLLYQRYHERMGKVALQILSEQGDAEDALQNAFMQVIRHFEKIHEIPCEELLFWLISIVKNESLMILRKKDRTVPFEDWDDAAEMAEDAGNYKEIVKLFSRLPETYRAALEMKLLLEYTDKEIARHLGVTETAVSTRVNRGRALLRKLAEKEGFHA